MKDTFKLAVYGTLRLNQGNHQVLGRYNPTLLSTETVGGYRMANTGGFPAICISDDPTDTIVVEVFEAPIEALRSCDSLEGYNENSPERSMYLRKTVETSVGDAYIYIWNGSIDRFSPIPDGDWLTRPRNGR